MKREDAILKISEKLQKQEALLQGYVKGSISLKCLCDNLSTLALDQAEYEIGMSPPMNFNITDYSGDQPEGYHPNDWEHWDDEVLNEFWMLDDLDDNSDDSKES